MAFEGGCRGPTGIKGRNFLSTLQWRSVSRGGRRGAVKFFFEIFLKLFCDVNDFVTSFAYFLEDYSVDKRCFFIYFNVVHIIK